MFIIAPAPYAYVIMRTRDAQRSALATKTTLMPHLRINPYKGSVTTVQCHSTQLDAPSALRAAHKLLVIVIPYLQGLLNNIASCICDNSPQVGMV